MICRPGKFTLLEQLWMQVTFQGIWVIGVISIFPKKPFFAVVYFLLVAFGILYLIQHSWICPRCPHIKDHSACVQLHPFLTGKLIRKNVTGNLKLYEKLGFFLVLYGVLFVIPLYWVVGAPYMIIPYAAFGAMHYSAYFLHFCKKCLNTYCPQNMNK